MTVRSIPEFLYALRHFHEVAVLELPYLVSLLVVGYVVAGIDGLSFGIWLGGTSPTVALSFGTISSCTKSFSELCALPRVAKVAHRMMSRNCFIVVIMS